MSKLEPLVCEAKLGASWGRLGSQNLLGLAIQLWASDLIFLRLGFSICAAKILKSILCGCCAY